MVYAYISAAAAAAAASAVAPVVVVVAVVAVVVVVAAVVIVVVERQFNRSRRSGRSFSVAMPMPRLSEAAEEPEQGPARGRLGVLKE